MNEVQVLIYLFQLSVSLTYIPDTVIMKAIGKVSFRMCTFCVRSTSWVKNVLLSVGFELTTGIPHWTGKRTILSDALTVRPFALVHLNREINEYAVSVTVPCNFYEYGQHLQSVIFWFYSIRRYSAEFDVVTKTRNCRYPN